MYTVGKLAKRFGLSRSTLLYYERIGLLRPSVHTKGDYRYYSDDDAERLARICSFREAGVSLSDIGTILVHTGDDAIDARSTPESTLYTILSKRLEEIGQEMQTLSHQRSIITRLIQQPTIDDALPLTKESWTAILAACGFSTEDMRRWHIDFERTAPEKHERFLALLGIPNDERQKIRAYSAAKDIHTITTPVQ